MCKLKYFLLSKCNLPRQIIHWYFWIWHRVCSPGLLSERWSFYRRPLERATDRCFCPTTARCGSAVSALAARSSCDTRWRHLGQEVTNTRLKITAQFKGFECLLRHTDGLFLVVIGKFSHFLCLFAIILAALLRQLPQDLTGCQSGCDTVSALQTHTHTFVINLQTATTVMLFKYRSDIQFIYAIISVFNSIWKNKLMQTTTNKI